MSNHIYGSELKIFGSFVNLLYKLKVIPVYWCTDRQRIGVSKGQFRRAMFFVQISLLAFDGIFQVVRTVQNSEAQGLAKFNLWRYAVENLITSICSVVLLWDPSLIPAVVNNMISTVERFHGI